MSPVRMLLRQRNPHYSSARAGVGTHSPLARATAATAQRGAIGLAPSLRAERPFFRTDRPFFRAERPFGAVIVALLTLAGLAADAAPTPTAETRLKAGRLTLENFTTWGVQGPDAIGGLGDWAIGNGTVCAVISDVEHESVLSEKGGVLVDLGHCDREDDQFAVLHPLMNLSRQRVLPAQQIEARVEAGEARVITSGELEGLAIETHYVLDLEQPTTLRIESRLSRIGPGERLFLVGDVLLHGHRQITPFGISTVFPHRSVGFKHPPVDVNAPLAMIGAMVPSDLQVLVGGDRLVPGIAYGLRFHRAALETAEGGAQPVSFLAINGEHFTLSAAFSRPFWVGGKGRLRLIEMAQSALMDLEPGETLVYERHILVGGRADVASVTDQIWPDAPIVRGRVDDPAARLHILDADEIPVTQSRPAPNGRFDFRLPPGSYRLEVHAPGRRVLERDFRVGHGNMQLTNIKLLPPARVQLPRGEAMRVTFVGLEDTEDPVLGSDLLGFEIGEESLPSAASANHVNLGGTREDPRMITLPAGKYRVFASRGPEYTAPERTLLLESGDLAHLDLPAPERVYLTPGWLAADLHVHAEGSDDSALSLRDRILAFVAQGAEALVSTEHDNVVDYAPTIRRLGLERLLASQVGSEVSSTVFSDESPRTIGHLNAFPLKVRPLQYRNGALRSEGIRVRELVRDLRSRVKGGVLQLNHPRAGGSDSGNETFFVHLSQGHPLEPTYPLTERPHRSLVEPDPETGLRDLDFDVIELMNGPSMRHYRLVRADWFSLLLQGEFRPATANGDSHRIGTLVALPRTYVQVPDDRVTAFDPQAFSESIRSGRSYGSTGPLLSVEFTGGDAPGAGLGDTFAGADGTLLLRVEAPAWVPVSVARIYVNGSLRETRRVHRGRLLEIPMAFEVDSFLTVEVEGPADEKYSLLNPDYTPFAFTNPIFIDSDMDGVWTASGLPDSLPLAIRRPLARH